MTLHEWVTLQSQQQQCSRTAILENLAKKSKVSLATLRPVDRGAKIRNYQKAQEVSKATGSSVTITELCE